MQLLLQYLIELKNFVILKFIVWYWMFIFGIYLDCYGKYISYHI